MNLRPTRTFYQLTCFFFVFLVLLLSCSKDVDRFESAFINSPEESVTDSISTENVVPELVNEINDDPIIDEEIVELENRTTSFPSIQDAYVQNGLGYDQAIVRLQENFRTSYLMFDLSEIDSIGGTIISVDLEFIINADDGDGTIQVFKGNSNDWSENSLTKNSVPEAEGLLGSIENQYYVDNKINISLDADKIFAEASTLILDHKDGDDLAFASKENVNIPGPILRVTYDAPIDSEIIVIENSQIIEETTEEETTEEETTEEETTEEETTEEETTEEETTEEEEPNIGPTAVAEATLINGTAPLEVTFRGYKSTDDKAVTSYSWNFKDGASATIANTLHTFTTPGTYAVELTVQDAEGLSNKDIVTITVSAPVNNPPVSVASADITSGTAPLQVNFTGSNSSDDQGISSYRWEFKDGSSSNSADPSHTFNTPGTYYVDLFVYNAQGLSDFTGLTITVEEEIIIDNSCATNGGYANDTGLKTWCWGDVNVPSGAASGRDSFSSGQLALSVECSANQVIREGDRLKFVMNPTNPDAASWCNNDYNMRSEIRTMPWKVNHPLGTEEWIGWSYTFGNNYVVDNTNPWLFFQMHQGISGPPPIELTVVPSSLYGAQNGEVVVINHANKTETDRTRTGVVPNAGTTLDIVVHVIHDLGSKGLLQIWINGSMVYNKQVGTVLQSAPWGGNAKFGIYKWPWREAEGVQQSLSQGINSLETYMGPLRILTRRTGDANYGQNSYNSVVPR